MFKDPYTDYRLKRPFTWAEECILKEAYNNVFYRIHIGWACPNVLDFWPLFLRRYVCKSLFEIDYIKRPFKEKDVYELTDNGTTAYIKHEQNKRIKPFVSFKTKIDYTKLLYDSYISDR